MHIYVSKAPFSNPVSPPPTSPIPFFLFFLFQFCKDHNDTPPPASTPSEGFFLWSVFFYCFFFLVLLYFWFGKTCISSRIDGQVVWGKEKSIRNIYHFLLDCPFGLFLLLKPSALKFIFSVFVWYSCHLQKLIRAFRPHLWELAIWAFSRIPTTVTDDNDQTDFSMSLDVMQDGRAPR